MDYSPVKSVNKEGRRSVEARREAGGAVWRSRCQNGEDRFRGDWRLGQVSDFPTPFSPETSDFLVLAERS